MAMPSALATTDPSRKAIMRHKPRLCRTKLGLTDPSVRYQGAWRVMDPLAGPARARQRLRGVLRWARPLHTVRGVGGDPLPQAAVHRGIQSHDANGCVYGMRWGCAGVVVKEGREWNM